MNVQSEMSIRFTARCAIVGGLFAYLNVILAGIVTQGDVAMVLDANAMLSLSSGMRDLYRFSMLADILGFYLPVLVLATYLWRAFRDQAELLGDVAFCGMLIYTVLGVSGAAGTLAALHPLAELHALGDGQAKAAAEAAWLATVHVSQKGLWWSEGPVVFFWVLVVGQQLKQAGWRPALLLPATIVGWGFGLFFVFGMFPALEPLMNLMLILVVVIFPGWMILFGRQLLARTAAR